MKHNLQTLVRRIDALSLRERVFLFLSAATVVVAVADALVISPQLALQRERGAQLARQNSELAQLRAQLAAAAAPAGGDSPAGRLQAALRAAQQERQRLGGETAAPAGPAASTGAAATGQPPARLADLLARVLRRHQGLSLVRLAVAPAENTAAATGAAAPVPGVQAVDLVLSGPYLALAAYLAEIEGTLPGLRWGPLQLQATPAASPREGSALLTLQLWLPGEVR